MERRAPRACLALLWGCVLGAAWAQGKEGELCAPRTRGRRPGPRRLREPRALPPAQVWKPAWRRRVPKRWGPQGARAAVGTNLGPPRPLSTIAAAAAAAPGVLGAGGSKGKRPRRARKGNATRATRLQPRGGFRDASRLGRGGPVENGGCLEDFPCADPAPG